MAKPVNPIPDGYHSITPYLICGGAAKAQRPVADQFYGDRAGSVEDPFGHTWHIHTHVEDLTPEEIARRAPKSR